MEAYVRLIEDVIGVIMVVCVLLFWKIIRIFRILWNSSSEKDRLFELI